MSNLINNTSYILDLIAKKQKVIGENLSNIDTPGYQRKDLNFSQYLGDTGASSLESKLDSKFGSEPVFDSQTGGTIDPGNELMALQKNSLLYSIATRQMSSIITQMKTAVNVGR